MTNYHIYFMSSLQEKIKIRDNSTFYWTYLKSLYHSFYQSTIHSVLLIKQNKIIECSEHVATIKPWTSALNPFGLICLVVNNQMFVFWGGIHAILLRTYLGAIKIE